MAKVGLNICGMILLENLSQENLISFEQLREESKVLFGLYGQDFDFSISNNGLEQAMIQDLNQLHKQVFYVYRIEERQYENLKPSLSYNNTGPFCKFINVEFNGKKGTVLLENPCGDASQVDSVQ